MNTMNKLTALAACSLCMSASAAITITDLGTGAPPASLGGKPMTAFGVDAQPLNSIVSQVVSPIAGSIAFSPSVTHLKVGSGWATWSHGYAGDVYYADYVNGDTVKVDMPSATTAFYFYAEPDFSFGPSFDIKVTANDGTSITVSVAGNAGANGFGLYTDTYLQSLEVKSDWGFAIGEFGISSVPEPSTFFAGLSALGLLGLFSLRNRKNN